MSKLKELSLKCNGYLVIETSKGAVSELSIDEDLKLPNTCGDIVTDEMKSEMIRRGIYIVIKFYLNDKGKPYMIFHYDESEAIEAAIKYIDGISHIKKAVSMKQILDEAIKLIMVVGLKYARLSEALFINYLKSVKNDALRLIGKADDLPITDMAINRDMFYGIMDDFDNIFLYYFNDEFLKRASTERQGLLEDSLGRIYELKDSIDNEEKI